jgi:SHS2 domain-containing protein
MANAGVLPSRRWPVNCGEVLRIKLLSDANKEQEVDVKVGWEHYAHGADIGVRGIGRSMAEAFEQAAVALAGVITDPSCVEARQEVTIECEAPDPEVLLVDWLNALVYEMAVRRMILARFRVNIEGNQLRAKAWGEEADVARHEPAVEVKGATYTDLFVGQNSSGAWVAQCVVDV